MDVQFPQLIFHKDKDPLEFGREHGESFKEAIHELASIRKNLMLERSPHLSGELNALAKEQWEVTQKEFPLESQELQGISQGAGIPISDLVILNNYTDFRDITLPEEGCSTVGFSQKEHVSGQTWDMHSTAKNYICTIERPGDWIAFSLVGCLGMMGANSKGLFVGVNNMNTTDARPGVLWPAFIRNCLLQNNMKAMRDLMKKTPFTGAHNYLLSDGKSFEHWEASPTKKFMASKIEGSKKGVITHTNHCLTQELQNIEEKLSQNSTSHERFSLLEQMKDGLQTSEDLIALLQDHTGYPKSLCGHFQSGAQDPSTTCGGGVFNHDTLEFYLWRGCPREDKNFKDIRLSLC